MADAAWDQQCFGCSAAAIREVVDNSISGPAMIAMSYLSDSQEMIEREDSERARQAINRAKFIISEYLAPKRGE